MEVIGRAVITDFGIFDSQDVLDLFEVDSLPT